LLTISKKKKKKKFACRVQSEARKYQHTLLLKRTKNFTLEVLIRKLKLKYISKALKKQRHRDSRQMETQTDREGLKMPAMHKNHRNTIGKLGLLKKQRRQRQRQRQREGFKSLQCMKTAEAKIE
jgi:hypothetical protein